MKKFFITLIVLAMLVGAAGVVSANPDEPVSNEVGSDTEPAPDEKVVEEEPAAADEGLEEPEADFVRPDEEAEIGITSVDGEEAVDAILYATGINEETNSGKQSWYYMGAGALVLVFAAALALRRKSSKA
jgi:hypothetical protein